MDLQGKRTENIAKTAAWSRDSLGYARAHGRGKLVRILEAVGIEVELEAVLLTLPFGEHLYQGRGNAKAKMEAENKRKADTAAANLKQKRAEENRAREQAAWERFMEEERRELDLRKNGQLAKLLGESLPGEPPEALRRLASEDQRQAEKGLVALMCKGKIFYKHVDELSAEDLPSRIATNRARTTWLKERRDGWLA